MYGVCVAFGRVDRHGDKQCRVDHDPNWAVITVPLEKVGVKQKERVETRRIETYFVLVLPERHHGVPHSTYRAKCVDHASLICLSIIFLITIAVSA